MTKQQIEWWVKSRLNGEDSSIPAANCAYERFLFNCANRLITAFALFKRDAKYKGDFLIAVRNYLLTFQTEVSISADICAEDIDAYGLWRNPETGTMKASYQFPKYINESFAQMAFLSSDVTASKSSDNKHYNLQTDPMIFHLTGFTQFRSISQKIALYGALNTPDGYTTLISLPTGGGKSLITQAIAYQHEGLTIAIVPTISLAIDQVRVARKLIKTCTPDEEIFYYSSGVDAQPILDAIHSKKARMLFISPEALILNDSFAMAIKEANAARFLKNIVIDEAHIVVDWGADFRIDYQCLESWRKKLIMQNPQIRTILLSATFERRCRDILKDFFSERGKWIEIRCDSLRHEPRYSLAKCRSNREKDKRIVELVRKCPHPVVVYVARPVDADHIVNLLHENGIQNVRTFTGLTPNAKRQELIHSWVNDAFDVMVATSAFGVGVDKGDIRTVLHTYVPQNPNAYYQELGRGGRDQLPCLSIMCIIDDDLAVSFQRISKKVMTTEKIVKRWDSLYNNLRSKRVGNLIIIDTSIKPNYAVEDSLDDIPTSDADIKWNAYVLLLLRRYGKIRIDEVVVQASGYAFVIEIIDDALRTIDDHLHEMIDAIRQREWNYHKTSYDLMRTAIKNNGRDCWSEMFFSTYDKVYEYCAGCAAHNMPVIGDATAFALKMPIEDPKKELQADQLDIFGSSSNLIIHSKPGKLSNTLQSLSRYRLSAFVVPKSFENKASQWFDISNANLLILDPDELSALIKKKSWFFISGMIAVLYEGSERDVFNLLHQVIYEFQQCPWVRLIHIVYDNTYFEWLGKSFTDLLDGRYIQAEALERV